MYQNFWNWQKIPVSILELVSIKIHKINNHDDFSICNTLVVRVWRCKKIKDGRTMVYKMPIRSKKWSTTHVFIIIYFENMNFFHTQLSKLGLDVCLEMKPLQISLNTAHSGCKTTGFILSFTHSLQIFLLLPKHLSQATSTFLLADTQSSPLLRSRWPNHLNVPHLSYTLNTQKTDWAPLISLIVNIYQSCDQHSKNRSGWKLDKYW